MSNTVEKDLAGLAAEKAAILRMLQVEMTDQPEDKRVEALRGALDEMVGSMPPDRRQAFLTELARRFPTWGGAGPAAAAPPATAGPPVRPAAAVAPGLRPGGPPPAAAAAATSPAALVDQLCAAAPQMSPDARAAAVRRLADAGFSLPPAAAGGSDGGGAAHELVAGPLRALLQVPPTQPLDPVRVGQLVSQVLELVLLSDPVVWGMWQQRIARGTNAIVCKSRARDEARAWLTAAAAEAKPERLRGVIADLRRLVVSMACTLADTPPQVDTAVRERLAPAQFEQAITIEGFRLCGPMGGNRRETECWRRFVEAYNAMTTSGGFEAICQGLVAATVETYFHGDGQAANG